MLAKEFIMVDEKQGSWNRTITEQQVQGLPRTADKGAIDTPQKPMAGANTAVTQALNAAGVGGTFRVTLPDAKLDDLKAAGVTTTPGEPAQYHVVAPASKK